MKLALGIEEAALGASGNLIEISHLGRLGFSRAAAAFASQWLNRIVNVFLERSNESGSRVVKVCKKISPGESCELKRLS